VPTPTLGLSVVAIPSIGSPTTKTSGWPVPPADGAPKDVLWRLCVINVAYTGTSGGKWTPTDASGRRTTEKNPEPRHRGWRPPLAAQSPIKSGGIANRQSQYVSAITGCCRTGVRSASVTARPRRPVAAVVSFIDCINRSDIEGLGKLMTEDHQLQVFDEPSLDGRQANVAAWHGYTESFPDYVIYPHRIAEHNGQVSVLGHTTGSHLRLPDTEEQALTLIWLVDVVEGMVRSWRLIEDTPERRQQLGLDLV
jgi:hypothetical protein